MVNKLSIGERGTPGDVVIIATVVAASVISIEDTLVLISNTYNSV
jgi:hypothetical protein